MTLSLRQRQAVEGIWNDCTVKEIAHDLGCSSSSVHTHLEEVRKKTKQRTTIAMLRVLLKKRLLKP